MSEHKQTDVEVFDKLNKVNRIIPCDQEITSLIFSLNEIGAVTTLSCQDIDGKGTVMIGFRQRNSKATLLHALSIISSYYPDRYVHIGINDMFEPIIYAAKRTEDIEAVVQTYKFSKDFGRETEYSQIKLMQKLQARKK